MSIPAKHITKGPNKKPTGGLNSLGCGPLCLRMILAMCSMYSSTSVYCRYLLQLFESFEAPFITLPLHYVNTYAYLPIA